MGAGATTALPYASVEEAKKAGKTQAEIDDWLAANLPKASDSTATMGGGSSLSTMSEAAAASAVDTSDAPKDDKAGSAAQDDKAGSAALDKQLALKYGVLHLKGALTEKEQKKLFRQVKEVANLGAKKVTTRATHKDFFVSSGKEGAPTRREPFHQLGNLLFQRVASRLAEVTTPGELATEPSLRRMQKVHSGKVPPHVNAVTGVTYQPGSRLNNHTDSKKAHLYTMSVALGDSCSFTVGKKTATPHKNERHGKPITLQMDSGDALFFDGGWVPHAVDGMLPGTAPAFWKRAKPASGACRVSLLFREVKTS